MKVTANEYLDLHREFCQLPEILVNWTSEVGNGSHVRGIDLPKVPPTETTLGSDHLSSSFRIFINASSIDCWNTLRLTDSI